MSGVSALVALVFSLVLGGMLPPSSKHRGLKCLVGVPLVGSLSFVSLVSWLRIDRNLVGTCLVSLCGCPLVGGYILIRILVGEFHLDCSSNPHSGMNLPLLMVL